MDDSTPEQDPNVTRQVDAIFQTFSDTLLRHGFNPDEHFLIGFSGGLDSAVMLHLIQRFCIDPSAQIRVAHIHHGLSPNADEWSKFCRQTCQKQALSYRQISLDLTDSGNLEATARNARYGALLGLMQPEEWLLVAHHRDDNVETLLLNLFRGAGARGLAGIPNQSHDRRLFRPMLPFSRQQIHEYAVHHSLQWMDDESNLNPRFDRNFLRLKLLPQLRARWTGVDRALFRAAENMLDASRLLDQLAEMDLATLSVVIRRPWSCHRSAFDLAGFRALTVERKNNLLRFLYRELSVYSPPRQAILRIADWLSMANSGEIRQGEITLRLHTGIVYLFDLAETTPDSDIYWYPSEESRVRWGSHWISVRQKTGEGVRFSAHDLENLSIGKRRLGEKIRLPGRAHRTPLKTYLQRLKIPPWERQAMPIIRVNGDAAVIPSLTVLEPYVAEPGESGYIFRLDQKNDP